MKKLLLMAGLLIAFTGMSFAQTTPVKTPKTKTSKVSATTKSSAATTTKTAVKPATTTTAGPTKKDGTADMRYKANKDAAKGTPATTHLKKDGTADKRFKENKTPKKTS